jgi:hypothetical protein
MLSAPKAISSRAKVVQENKETGLNRSLMTTFNRQDGNTLSNGSFLVLSAMDSIKSPGKSRRALERSLN